MKPLIGLAMIVKNEEHTIPRLAESLRGQIDHFTIIDTGSSDDTVSVAYDAFIGLGIKGTVLERDFTGFGPTRNEAIDAARQHTEWVLVMDADEVLHGGLDLTAPDGVDAIAAEIREGSTTTWMPYLIRSDSEWHQKGRTHEEWVGPGKQSLFASTSFYVEHRLDHDARVRNGARDIAFLDQDLADDPYDVRAVFFKAQTYEVIGETGNAIEWYKKRLLFAEDNGNRWLAQWHLGACLLSIGRDQEGTEALIEAYKSRQWRAEPLWLLAEHYRKARQWKLAFDACEVARKNCQLDKEGGNFGGDRFIHHDVYRWLIDFEQSISAYYVGRVELGMQLTKKLSEREDLPGDVAVIVAQNLRRYEKALGES